ncbi:lysozyme inhibitor LprI family protein [Sphingomicrobium aestuariivivum]|uniref:lysozyme inhibitor LprI family protein n=1 Tax=Sphingomicrobium aestuariivivum TaxID=1582356 RepID=UPI001FD71233|nr:lysozyme inhibitor LprI family protein [Sphingomicrobium aestuariivivum]MCJ8191487.1 lysozyme inhibitor LprI family protein [Sphingomicrobium aestuariivivum]
MILSALLLATAQAADADPDCGSEELAQIELNWCAWKGAEEADAELNLLWDRIGGDMRARMLPSQRAWLAYRDAQCEAEGKMWEGGSAHSMIVGMCMERMTRARMTEIRNSHPEGPDSY